MEKQQSNFDTYQTQQLNNQSSIQISPYLPSEHPPGIITHQMNMNQNNRELYYSQQQYEYLYYQNMNQTQLDQQPDVQYLFPYEFDPNSQQPDNQSNLSWDYCFKVFPFVNADYTDVNDVAKKIYPLKLITQDEKIIINQNKEQFFQIFRSSSYYNLHQAAKYGIWTQPSQFIQNTIENFQTKEKSNPGKIQYIGLFVFVQGDILKLFGIAEIDIQFHSDSSYYLWDKEENNYFGYFDIKWLRIGEMDISNPRVNYKQILQRMYNFPQEVKIIFQDYLNKCDPKQLLTNFSYYDSQENRIRVQRLSQPNKDSLQYQFSLRHQQFQKEFSDLYQKQNEEEIEEEQEVEEEQEQENQSFEKEENLVELENKQNERYLHTMNLDDENVLEEILRSGIDVSCFFK